MISITPHLNNSKIKTDNIFINNDEITINNITFSFEQGTDIIFEQIHPQIIGAHRDHNGILYAVIIKYCTKKDITSHHIKSINPSFSIADPNPHPEYDPNNNIKIKILKYQKTLSEKLHEKYCFLEIIQNKIFKAKTNRNHHILSLLYATKKNLISQISELEASLA